MSRDGSGVYHRPVGTDAVTDTTIESTKYNVNVADVEQDLNLPRPIVAGGTGATSPAAALLALSGETAKQIVTNWDSMVWLPGSFYAATTASGAGPVAGHAFAGIAYYANATDLVNEATDLTDPLYRKYSRVMSSGVWGPWSVINATVTPPITASIGEYTFDPTTTFPPGSGQIRLNNATQNSATEIFLSHTTATGVDVTASIPLTIKSGLSFVIQDKVDVTKYKVFTATADPVLSGGDYRVTATLKSSGIDLVAAQRVLTGATGSSAVLYDTVQALTASQQTQARQNVYAAPFDAMAYNGLQINGQMGISQENGSAAVVLGAGTVSKYVVDGFYGYKNSTATITAQQTAGQVIGTGFFCATLSFTATSAMAASTATEYAYFGQKIEGFRIARLGWGKATAQPLSISFWIKSTIPGRLSMAIQNNGITRSYITDFAIIAANTWEYKTVVIPGDVTGTWTQDNTTGLSIFWTLAAGLNYQTVSPNVWTSQNFIATGAQTNFLSTINNQVQVTGVTVFYGTEVPSAARSPYIIRPDDVELVVCSRHYQNFNPTGVYLPVSATAANVVLSIPITAVMRAAPTITLPWNNGNYTSGALTVGTWQLVTPGLAVMSVTGGSFTFAISPTPTSATVVMYAMTLSGIPTAISSGGSVTPVKLDARL